MFDPSSFNQCLLAMIYDLQSINRADYEEPLHDFDPSKTKLGIEFKPFALAHPKEITFEDDLRIYFFLEHLLVATSNKICCKLYGI